METSGEVILSNLAICVGIVSERNKELEVHHRKLAHLVVLEQPGCVLTQPWAKGEHFEPGKWYRHVQRREEITTASELKSFWQPIDDDLVPTVLLRNSDRRTLIEMALPIFFAPDFSGLETFSQLQLKSPRLSQTPVCPLFGPENVQMLCPLSNGFVDRNGNEPLPGKLYCARVQLSFASGSLPIWAYGQDFEGVIDPFQWSSAFNSKDSLYSHMFKAYRADGIVVEKVTRCGIRADELLHYCLLLTERSSSESNPKLAVAVFEERDVNVGDWLSFLPIPLGCYNFPVLFALDCPASDSVTNKGERNVDGECPFTRLRKTGINYECEFSVPLGTLIGSNSGERLNKNFNTCNFHLPVLGLVVDPFNIFHNESFVTQNHELHDTIEIRPQWYLDRGVAVWTAVCSFLASRLEEEEEEDKQDYLGHHHEENVVNNGCSADEESEEYTDKLEWSSPARGEELFVPPSWHNNSPSAKGAPKILAVYFSLKCLNESFVFLEFDEQKLCFTSRYDIPIKPNIHQSPAVGEWYFIELMTLSASQIVIKSIVKTTPRVRTRVTMGVCSQFFGGGKPIIHCWHYSAEFCNCARFYEDDDGDWWPLLCVKCFPEQKQHHRVANRSQPLREPMEAVSSRSRFSTMISMDRNISSSSTSLLGEAPCEYRPYSTASTTIRDHSSNFDAVNRNFSFVPRRLAPRYQDRQHSLSRTTSQQQQNCEKIKQKLLLEQQKMQLHQKNRLEELRKMQENAEQQRKQRTTEQRKKSLVNSSNSVTGCSYANREEEEDGQSVKQHPLRWNSELRLFQHCSQPPKPVVNAAPVRMKFNNNYSGGNEMVEQQNNNGKQTGKIEETSASSSSEIFFAEATDNDSGEQPQFNEKTFMESASRQQSLLEEGELEAENDKTLAADFCSLSVSDGHVAATVPPVNDFGGFGYAKRRRFPFVGQNAGGSSQPHQQQEQHQQRENPFRKFNFSSANNGKKENKVNGGGDEAAFDGGGFARFSVDEALHASLPAFEEGVEYEEEEEEEQIIGEVGGRIEWGGRRRMEC